VIEGDKFGGTVDDRFWQENRQLQFLEERGN
jgi:hypothetical protein